VRGILVAANKQSRRAQPTPADADVLRQAIHALGDYGHVTVRAARGHLTLYVDDGTPIARATPLGAGQFGLSFRTLAPGPRSCRTARSVPSTVRPPRQEKRVGPLVHGLPAEKFVTFRAPGYAEIAWTSWSSSPAVPSIYSVHLVNVDFRPA
jgi:hypothetical protein